jgi:sphinganine-1-phosphate aldolase
LRPVVKIAPQITTWRTKYNGALLGAGGTIDKALPYPAMGIPLHGRDRSEIFDALARFQTADVRWKEGRAFSLAYYAGPEAYAVATDAYTMFSSENSLNTDAFPSLKQMQNDVISNVASLLGGDERTVGVFTSGGTESILTAVKGARQWGRARGITRPEMILPTTAHAAFSKAAAYFDVRTIRVPVRTDYRADVEAMASAVTPDTVLVVGSAPAYPQGVIDPIAELGTLAQEFDVLFHVDACMGFTLPWLEKLGVLNKPWNFSVAGVTSMSCDLHKFGYVAKGASVLLHRTKELRKHQFFLTDDWLGGLYGSPAILGTRSGGSLASAWAMQQYFGEDGYVAVTKRAYEAREALQRKISSIDGVAVRGEPEATLVAFGADLTRPADEQVDIYAVGDYLWQQGWYCDRQTPPDSLHCTVNSVHADVVEEFAAVVAEGVAKVTTHGDSGDRSKAYGTL